MSRQAAQQRFGLKVDAHEDSPERRRLVGLTAANEIDRLNEWGARGWHSIGFGPSFHDIEKSGTRWEHRRAVVGSRKARELESSGWQRIAPMWFPWVYFKRPIGGSVEPGESA